MTFDPYAPYGPPIESTFRLATWNVWGRYGDASRQQAIERILVNAAPDVVCLTEAWSQQDADQAQEVASALQVGHHRFSGSPAAAEAWSSGIALVSRWPVVDEQRRPLVDLAGEPRGAATFFQIDGPRGVIEMFGVMLDYPLSGSAVRQHQVRQLLEFMSQAANHRHVTVLCGDFNAGPDSDEMRALTGRSAPPVAGMVFYDAWEVAGDGGPGYTFAQSNPLTAPNLFPDRRFDYILSAWPRRGGGGHPVCCRVIGSDADGPPASDHYGVVADLRY
jgi:endonuclease/exonuclease/phosphatase family metal-dependent hydrolase